MQRIQRGRSETITHTFYSDGVATNPSPDSATVTITRDDGTVLVNAAAATDTGAGTVSYPLTPTQTALLDILTVEWTATFGGQSQVFTDYVEVVGGFLFTIAEARSRSPLGNTATYSTADIISRRIIVEQEIEDACGVAFVPRYGREQLAGTGTFNLILSRPRITAIRSITNAGIALSSAELATIVSSSAGVLYYPAGWTPGVGSTYANYDVIYEHGYVYPPEPVRDIALFLLRDKFVNDPASSGVDPRTTSIVTPDGTIRFGEGRFGVPWIDSTLANYDERALIA